MSKRTPRGKAMRTLALYGGAFDRLGKASVRLANAKGVVEKKRLMKRFLEAEREWEDELKELGPIALRVYYMMVRDGKD